MTNIAYPWCPVCGSTSHCCWILETKERNQRNRWHRERMTFDYRRVPCVECGAPAGQVCRTQGDCPTKAHKQRKADFRDWLLNNNEIAALPF